MKITVAGTGYVGLVTAVSLAHIGNNVTCVDIEKEKIEKLKNGISPIYEEHLEELMKKNSERLNYTTDYKEAYKNADIIFIGVGTPEKSDDNDCDIVLEMFSTSLVIRLIISPCG